MGDTSITFRHFKYRASPGGRQRRPAPEVDYLMTQDATLRILILEDVPMDAELVEYELERARIPFLSRRVDSREAFLRELDGVPAPT